MSEFADSAEYNEELKRRGVLPAGFLAASVPLTFYPKEKRSSSPYSMDLSAILTAKPTKSFAGVFTKNKAPGAPVLVGRELLKAKTARGVIVNNRIANVCVSGGKHAALEIADTFIGALGCGGGREEGVVFPSSTGIIGWELPIEPMETAAKELAGLICSRSKENCGSLYPVARGIMTTDAFPKIRSAECGEGRIVATAKGAGMIEPNMGTLLVFITTDITVRRESLREILPRVMDKSFNCISIDGDQSTSDTAFLLSSCRVDDVEEEVFEDALVSVCRNLAEDVVRNGEGTTHLIKVSIRGAEDEKTARGFGKAVINSPLVKTAIFGNDPNVGRILMALGKYAGNNDLPFHAEVTNISIGEIPVFRDGVFLLNEEKEVMLNAYLTNCAMEEVKDYPPHERGVNIDIDLNCGAGKAEVFGSDLSYQYVRENADYRT